MEEDSGKDGQKLLRKSIASYCRLAELWSTFYIYTYVLLLSLITALGTFTQNCLNWSKIHLITVCVQITIITSSSCLNPHVSYIAKCVNL